MAYNVCFRRDNPPGSPKAAILAVPSKPHRREDDTLSPIERPRRWADPPGLASPRRGVPAVRASPPRPRVRPAFSPPRVGPRYEGRCCGGSGLWRSARTVDWIAPRDRPPAPTPVARGGQRGGSPPGARAPPPKPPETDSRVARGGVSSTTRTRGAPRGLRLVLARALQLLAGTLDRLARGPSRGL